MQPPRFAGHFSVHFGCGLALLLALIIGLGLTQPVLADPVWQIQTLDPHSGTGTALALDSQGNPVISFYSSGGLKVMHCDNPTCTGSNTIRTRDSFLGSNLEASSLALDSNGEPVISYYDGNTRTLWLAGTKRQKVDDGLIAGVRNSPKSNVGQYNSLGLDSSDNPVISYFDDTNDDLRVVKCGNPTCSSGNTIKILDSQRSVGQYNSLVMNSSGYPVISYYDQTNGDLKLAYCNNATCTAAGWVPIDEAGDVGKYTALALDSHGNPVISYYGNHTLKVAKCGNLICSSGNTITVVDSAGWVGSYSSLALDSNDNPVISYYDATNGDLKLVHCGNPTCSSGNAFKIVDSTGNVGEYTSLALDSNGYAVIIYSATSGLKLAREGIPPTATPTSIPVSPTPTPMSTPVSPTPTPSVAVGTVDAGGEFSSLALDSSGKPIISYFDRTNQDLKVVKCGNPACSSGNTTAIVDSAGDVGRFTALKLDSSGYPVISYYDQTNGDLKLVHCGNAGCSSGNTIWTVDSPGDVGMYTALALDSSGYPVISYWDLTKRDLKLVHCGNATCTAGGTIWTVDSLGAAGLYSALALNSSGYPIMSYLDESNYDLRLVYCGNAACTAGGGFQTVDSAGTVGMFTALALDGSGKPVISYYDDTNGDLKLVYCGNATCSVGNTIRAVDGVESVGQYTALALDGKGNPVISYYDVSNRDLKLVQCGNATCSSANTIRTVDSAGDVGQHTSLKLDSSGNAVISYYDYTNNKLKLARVPAAPGGVAASAVGSPLGAAQPLTTTEVAAAPALVDPTSQTQRLFLPLVVKQEAVVVSVSGADAATAQTALVAAPVVTTTTLPVAELAAVTPTQSLSSLAPAASVTASLPLTLENAAVVTATFAVSTPTAVTAPVVVEPTSAANAAADVASSAPVTDTTSQNQQIFLPLISNVSDLAGAALGSFGSATPLVFVVLILIGGVVWVRLRRIRR